MTDMARLPDETVTRLKQEVSLQRLVEGMGITLKRHGSDLIGLCPFRDDKEPSLVISPEKNLWHCLGACQTGGSVIDWVMKAEGASFRHAVELLLADYDAQGCTNAAGGTTPGMEEVERSRKSEPRTPGATEAPKCEAVSRIEEAPLLAKVIPEPPMPDIQAEVKEDEVIICFGDRRYRIRGLDKKPQRQPTQG
jgi:hypothetical protein